VRALLVLAVAAAAAIAANVALLGVVATGDEPVGKLRPRAVLTTSAAEPPAAPVAETETRPAEQDGGHGDDGDSRPDADD
jgi:predicted porin